MPLFLYETLRMATVCQKCGVEGFSELLVYCVDCQLAAEHCYCLNEVPESYGEAKLLCERCEQKAPKMASVNDFNVECFSKEMKCKDSGYSQCVGLPSFAYPRPPKKKRNKNHKYKNAKARAKPSRFAKDSHESMGLMSEHYLMNEQRKYQSSNTKNSEEDEKIMRQRRRLILTEEGSDGESESLKLGQNSRDKCNYNQESKRLQDLSCAASESQTTTPVGNVLSTLPNTSLNELNYDHPEYVHAQPIIDPVWSGCFDVNNRNYNVVAHLSHKACPEVHKGIDMLSSVLSVKVLPRAAMWPDSFQRSRPTDDNIGLYFFPKNERYDVEYSQMVKEMNDADLSLKVVFAEAELLIFSSEVLPLKHSRFNGECYLWGAFKSLPHSQPQGGKMCSENSILESALASKDSHEGEKPDWLSRSTNLSNDSHNHALELFPVEVEDIAVVARLGGRPEFHLELGLGRCVGQHGGVSPDSKHPDGKEIEDGEVSPVIGCRGLDGSSAAPGRSSLV